MRRGNSDAKSYFRDSCRYPGQRPSTRRSAEKFPFTAALRSDLERSATGPVLISPFSLFRRERRLYNDPVPRRADVSVGDEVRPTTLRDLYLSLSPEAGARPEPDTPRSRPIGDHVVRHQQYHLSELVSHRQGRLRYRLRPRDATRRPLQRLRHLSSLYR